MKNRIASTLARLLVSLVAAIRPFVGRMTAIPSPEGALPARTVVLALIVGASLTILSPMNPKGIQGGGTCRFRRWRGVPGAVAVACFALVSGACSDGSFRNAGTSSQFEVVERVRIGSLNGETAFGHIAALDWGPNGRIRVADGFANEISEFSAAGDPIRSFGRQGEGPGEFQRILAMVSVADSFVITDWAGARQRYMIFDSTGQFVREVPRDVSGVLPPGRTDYLGGSRILDFGVELDHEERIVVVPYAVNLATGEYRRYPGLSGETFPRDPIPIVSATAYMRALRWDLGEDGALWYGFNNEQQLLRRDLASAEPDDTLELQMPPVPISATLRRRLLDSAAVLGSRLPPSLVPDVLPFIQSIWSLGDGLLAIVRPPEPLATAPGTRLNLYLNGHFSGQVSLEHEWEPPRRVRGRQVLSATRDAAGVPHVSVIEFREIDP